MRRRVELRDLRSLERPGLRRLFEPLDTGERLPRELLLEGRRHLWLERHKLIALFGLAYLPALLIVVVVLATLGVSEPLAFGVGGVLLLAIFAVALRLPAR